MSSTRPEHWPESISEEHGIAAIPPDAKAILSVGISTGGSAEIRMAQHHPDCHITATTIDKDGLDFAASLIAQQGLSQRIETKLEDITAADYQDAMFDYVYARLVLHYLPEAGLRMALARIYSALKPGGKLFVVVRSTECPAAKRPDSTFDPVTHLTACVSSLPNGERGKLYYRFFHTPSSISGYLVAAGFEIDRILTHDERLYSDFYRKNKSNHDDNVIEVLAGKP